MIWPSSGAGYRKKSGDFSGAYLTEARKDDRITSLAGSRLILAHAGRQPRGPHLSLERPPAARLLTKGDSMPSEEDIEVGRIFAELAEGSSVYAAVRTFLAAASSASPVEAVSRAITSPFLNLGALTSELVASTARNMAPDMPLSFADAFDAYLATPEGRTMAAEAKKAADDARRAGVEWRASWRADYGMDLPEETADFIRAGVRAGLDANYLVGKQWTPCDILPVIEGYLQKLQDQRVVDAHQASTNDDERQAVSPEKRENTPPRDGPGEGDEFYWNGVRHNLDIEPKPLKLLRYLWDRLDGRGEVKVSLQDVARTVWKDRTLGYDHMKSAVSKMNTALVGCGIPLSVAKARGEDVLTFERSTI